MVVFFYLMVALVYAMSLASYLINNERLEGVWIFLLATAVGLVWPLMLLYGFINVIKGKSR